MAEREVKIRVAAKVDPYGFKEAEKAIEHVTTVAQRSVAKFAGDEGSFRLSGERALGSRLPLAQKAPVSVQAIVQAAEEESRLAMRRMALTAANESIATGRRSMRQAGFISGEEFGEAAGEAGEKTFLDRLNAGFGRGSYAGKFAKVLKGGGALFAASLIAHEVETTTQRIREISDRGGGFWNYAEAIPIAGQFIKAGENIAEAYTGAAKAVGDLKAASDALKDTQFGVIKTMADRYTQASDLEIGTFKSARMAKRELEIDQVDDEKLQQRLRLRNEIQDRFDAGNSSYDTLIGKADDGSWDQARLIEKKREFEKNLSEEFNARSTLIDREFVRRATANANEQIRANASAFADQAMESFSRQQTMARDFATERQFRGAAGVDDMLSGWHSLLNERFSRDSANARGVQKNGEEQLRLLKESLPRIIEIMLRSATTPNPFARMPSI